MLYRGRYKDAADEVAKIEAAEMEGATDLIIQEKEFVEAASKTQAAMAAGQSPAESSKLVQSFIKIIPRVIMPITCMNCLAMSMPNLRNPRRHRWNMTRWLRHLPQRLK